MNDDPTEEKKCWCCQGAGWFYALPEGMGRFQGGLEMLVQAAVRKTCWACDGTGKHMRDRTEHVQTAQR